MTFFHVIPYSEFLKLADVPDTSSMDPNAQYCFPPKYLLQNGARIFEILLYLGYAYEYYLSYFYVHSLLRMVAYQSVVMTILTSISWISLIFAPFFHEKNFLLLQTSLYIDVTINYFSIVMLLPLIINQVLSRTCRYIWLKSFTKSRIIGYITLCAILSFVAAVFIIQTSGMKRLYVKRTGFVDSGTEGYQLIFNRIISAFPIGSLLSYIIILVHARIMARQVNTGRATDNGKQRVFKPLFITILLFVIVCILSEILNHLNWSSDIISKMPIILNVLHALPEVSLPFLLLASNKEIKKKIINWWKAKSNNVSVANPFFTLQNS